MAQPRPGVWGCKVKSLPGQSGVPAGWELGHGQVSCEKKSAVFPAAISELWVEEGKETYQEL